MSEEAIEQAYIRGSRQAWLRVFNDAAHHLGASETRQAAEAQELFDARNALRELFEEHGLEGFEERLYLADLIEKVLERQIQKAT